MEINKTATLEKPTLNTSFITVDEMAKFLSIAKATAYQVTKTKDFPCFYIGKRIIIPLSPFKEWVNKQSSNKSTLL